MTFVGGTNDWKTFKGFTHEWNGLACAAHTVEVQAPGYAVGRGVPSAPEVRDGQTTTVTFAVSPKPSRITFTSNAKEAIILNAGQEIGKVDAPLSLPSFVSHTLTVRAQGYADGRTTFVLNQPDTPFAAREVTLEEQRDPTAGNVLGMAFVEVAAGSFEMGSNSGESDEKPVRTVRITRDFWMGKYEVTNKEYEQFIRESGYDGRSDADSDYLRHHRDWAQYASRAADYPVVAVSWKNADAFCKWLTKQEERADRLPSGMVYRLPTEAEWEFAARGGTKSRGYTYSGGNDLNAVGWYTSNSGGKTQPVRRKQANELEIHDMSGNVWEWVHDWYQNSYSGLTTTDPTGPANGSYRVSRGGSWYFVASRCRVANRNYGTPTHAYSGLGFRVVLAAPVQ